MKGIDYFYRGHFLSSLQEKISYRTRKKMYDLWDAEAPQKVLDVGATPDCERLDSNCFIPWIVESGHSLSVVSPEDITHLQNIFPKITVLPPIASGTWNIRDDSYDWVFSSAVLEHVGSSENQIKFISECGRIGRGIFLTTPDRCHWLEFHTKIPFLHWLPKKYHRSVLTGLGMEFWSREENLNLVNQKELSILAETALGKDFHFEIKKVWALGMPSNLILIAQKKKSDL